MARSREVVVKILGDSRSAERAFGSLGKATETTAQKVQKTAMGISKAVAIPFAAAALVGINELKEVAQVNAQTDAALKSTGGQANVTGKEIRGLADELQNLTAVDAEEIQSAENLLLTFTNIQNQAGKNNDIFNQATEISLDLSRALGKDLQSSAIMVGKALNDPIKGVTALGRAGVQFSEDQKAMLTSLVETGDTLGAQKIILKELKTQVGGSAEAYGKTFAGQVERAKFALEDAAGNMLQVAIPAVEKLAGVVSKAAEAIADLPDPLKNTGLAIAGIALVAGPTIAAINKLTAAYKSLVTFMGTAKAIETLGFGLSGLSTLAGEAAIGIGKLASGLKVAAPALIAVADLVDMLGNGLEQNLARKAGMFNKVFGGDWSGKAVDDLGAVAEASERLGGAVVKSSRKVMAGLSDMDLAIEKDKQKAQEWHDSAAQNFMGVEDSLQSLADKHVVTGNRIERAIEKQIQLQLDYNKNFKKVVERAGGDADSLVKYLTDMGLDGAKVVEALANSNDKKFREIIADWRKAQKASGEVGRIVAGGLDPIEDKIQGIRAEVAQLVSDLANDLGNAMRSIGSGTGGGGGGGGERTGGRPPAPRSTGATIIVNGDINDDKRRFERRVMDAISVGVARAQAT